VHTQQRLRTGKSRATLGGAAPHVLVVDHDPRAAEEAFRILSQLGYAVLVAMSAGEALRCLARRSYTCVVVDVGREDIARPVIEELRRYPSETVALVVTCPGGNLSAIDALREGALDYIHKPFDPDLMKASVARAIERASLVRTMRELVEDFDTTNSRLRGFTEELQSRVDRMTAQLRDKVAELHQANVKLAEERRRREEFIAMVAHDLAGPLTTVTGYIQVVTRDDVSADLQQRARATILSESRRIMGLLRDLTDAVPLTSGSFRVQPISCDLTTVIKEQVDLAQLRSDRHHIRLETPSGPLPAICDPDRLRQVLSNLLGNALKYSPGGEITVRLWAEDQQARLSLHDEGRGIPPDQLQTIFEPGVRVAELTEDEAASPQGAGLGLHIARVIVEALGGRIWAESDGTRGATFHIALSLAVPQPV
jgi:signal transduction histidine kinase